MISVKDISVEGSKNISSELFGGNLLAPTVPLTGEASYQEAIEYLGVTGLRFPGGSLTEFAFDISDPDRSVVYNPDLDVTWNMIGLTEFMTFAGSQDHDVTLVIPTRTYLTAQTDENGNRYANVDEDGLRAFITKVVTGEYGSATIEAFEIGNEYWGSGQMNAVEYGRLASEMSLIINDELSKAGNYETDILVQKGNNFDYSRISDDYLGFTPEQALSDLNSKYAISLAEDAIFSDGNVNWAYVNAKLIMSEFETSEEWAAVDGVVTHIYSRGDAAEETRYFDLDQVNKTWIAENPQLEIYITEWNLKSEPNLNSEEDYGLFQAQEVLNIMEEFVRTGVDNAHVWPLVQNTSNPLAEGTDYSGATSPGEMFALMSETLPGKTLLDLNPANRDTEATEGSVSTHMFAGENELALYIMNTSKTSGAVADVDLSAFLKDFGSVEALVLGVADGQAAGDTSSAPVVEELDGEVFSDGFLEATLSPGEIMQIVFTDVVPTNAFSPAWEEANVQEDTNVAVPLDSNTNDSDEFPFPTIDMPEDEYTGSDPTSNEEVEDDEGFGFEFGLGILFLLSMAGLG